MNKQQLQARAAEIEGIMDASDEMNLPYLEAELCKIYYQLRAFEMLGEGNV